MMQFHRAATHSHAYVGDEDFLKSHYTPVRWDQTGVFRGWCCKECNTIGGVLGITHNSGCSLWRPMSERRNAQFRYNLTSVHMRRVNARRKFRLSVLFVCWIVRTQRAFKERVYAPGAVLANRSKERFEVYITSLPIRQIPDIEVVR